METFESESCVRGYHIYQELWEAAVGEDLECQRESGNTADAYAVSVLREGTIIGHLPRKISRVCTLFIRRGSRAIFHFDIRTIDTGSRRLEQIFTRGSVIFDDLIIRR